MRKNQEKSGVLNDENMYSRRVLKKKETTPRLGKINRGLYEEGIT